MWVDPHDTVPAGDRLNSSLCEQFQEYIVCLRAGGIMFVTNTAASCESNHPIRFQLGADWTQVSVSSFRNTSSVLEPGGSCSWQTQQVETPRTARVGLSGSASNLYLGVARFESRLNTDCPEWGIVSWLLLCTSFKIHLSSNHLTLLVRVIRVSLNKLQSKQRSLPKRETEG
jgi:hypothetical protein